MKLSKRLGLATGMAVLALTPASATHSWGGYHWATTGVLNAKVNLAIQPQWGAATSGAIADWDKSRVLSLTAQTAVGVSTKRCSPIAGQVLVCDALYGQRGWLGLATIWLSNGHISQAVTQLNDTYFNMARYNTPGWRALVACQEIGHDWGLDHQDENFDNVNLGTCMDYTRAPDGGVYNGFNYGPSNTDPNKHDYEELEIIYNHNDGYTSATFRAPNAIRFGLPMLGANRSSNEPAGLSMVEWGQPIHFDRYRRPDVFVKDLGFGQRKLTHVFWAIGERAR